MRFLKSSLFPRLREIQSRNGKAVQQKTNRYYLEKRNVRILLFSKRWNKSTRKSEEFPTKCRVIKASQYHSSFDCYLFSLVSERSWLVAERSRSASLLQTNIRQFPNVSSLQTSFFPRRKFHVCA